MIEQAVIYGEGGFDPSAPNDNIVEIVDIVVPVEPSIEERIAALEVLLEGGNLPGREDNCSHRVLHGSVGAGRQCRR
jgi:hypothetical protein